MTRTQPPEPGCGQRSTRLWSEYIELACRDVEAGARLVNAMLREGGINKRTWILFHDEELADEWIGVCPDTPPPPSRH